MSHVDEGMLHAYLDGGLSALDAVRVERHVADCGPCRQRLDQARGLIQRAARLLEWASPPADRAAPPLADLPPAPAVGEAPRWRVPVAWAATIVIALGAGIYGGQRLLTPGHQESADVAAPREAEAFADRRAAAITVLAESTARRDEAKSTIAPTDLGQMGTGAVTTTGIVRESTAALNQVAQAPAAKAPADSVRPQVILEEAIVGAARDSFAAWGMQRAVTPPAAAVTGAAEGARARDPVFSSYAAPVWPQIGADSARALLGTAPLSIPDLPVTAIRTLNGVVAVEQVVPPGRVIRLLQRRGAADEEQERAAGELLARFVDGLRVEISGPMAADSLSKLLERARAIP